MSEHDRDAEPRALDELISSCNPSFAASKDATQHPQPRDKLLDYRQQCRKAIYDLLLAEDGRVDRFKSKTELFSCR
jgi:hypothetical protein